MQVSLTAMFVLVNSPVVIVPLVIGLNYASLAGLSIVAMLLLMAIIYKQLSLFLEISEAGSHPITRKLVILAYFLVVSNFLLIWLIRVMEMLLMENGFPSPNANAATCYERGNADCSWV